MSGNEARLELLIDVFDRPAQRASAQASLLPAELVAAVLEEFREIEYLGADPTQYQLRKAATRAPLDEQAQIGKQLAAGDRLTLAERAEPTPPGARALSRPVYLRDQASGAVYALRWQPAIIGRADPTRADNPQLAVDLSAHSVGQRVSRRHAQIVEANGQLYVERLAQNPTAVKSSKGATTRLERDRLPVQAGDTILLENSEITLKLIVREKDATA